MNEQTYTQVLTGANSHLNPQFVWGYQHSDITAEELYLNRAALDVVEVERAATLLLGELMGLKLDEEIFRSTIPQHHNEGFEVNIFTELQQDNSKYRDFEINCCGRLSDRNELLQYFSKIGGKLPLPTWLSISYSYMNTSVKFAVFQQIGELQFNTIKFDGDIKYYGSVNFLLKVSI